MIGKRVRIRDREIKFFLNESHDCFEYPNGKFDYTTYDKAIEINLLMAIFKDSYPGIIKEISLKTNNLHIEFDNNFTAFFPLQDLIFQD